MKQPEQPLYPKLSSIYNKILQLASAILLIIVLMSMWQSINVKDQVNLQNHFDFVAKQYLQQAASSAQLLLQQKYSSKAARNKAMQSYLDDLVKVDFVNQVHLYDEKGQLLLSASQNDNPEEKKRSSRSINELYGIDENKANLSAKYTPFIREIRGKKLYGYVRFTIEESYLTQVLSQADTDRQTLFRLMLLLAGVVGFLLTRGLNRFSRRSYRINKQLAKQQANS
ncbi:hypothetical protein [Litorilituus sediminis]|uniref:Smp protein n=1 Tax=Litorilituus sediminis TaxID=718192 RepID=A0A4P6P5N2_9GAMM|nr:hypothetical protein [Litorilituus sediminis]QBG35449.1 hypothetical protein EMK97_06805 [Litorilituus sediminis]